MNDDDLQALLPALEGFHARFGRFFRRSEGRAFGRQYLIGLTLPIERKNAENIAEQVGAPPRKLQEFLSESPWDDEGCIGELQRFVGEQFGAPDVRFKTKLELAGEMLEAAAARGHLPYQWVTADAAYGDSHELRRLVAAQGRWYCFEVSRDAEAWTAHPGWLTPPPSGRAGRPHTRARPGPDSVPARTVDEIVRSLPAGDWIRHRVTEGEKGPRGYEFARLRVIEKIHRAPGPEGWLMARRPVGSDPGADIKCYLSNAPATIALAEMAWVGCLRWTIEEDFELAKGEVGLDHYEVTKYRGWYHHITMALLALAFLKSVQREWGKKRSASLGAGGAPAA